MSWLLVLQLICKYSNSEIIVTTFQFPPKRWYRKNFGSIVKRILLSPIKQKKNVIQKHPLSPIYFVQTIRWVCFTYFSTFSTFWRYPGSHRRPLHIRIRRAKSQFECPAPRLFLTPDAMPTIECLWHVPFWDVIENVFPRHNHEANLIWENSFTNIF